MAPPANVGAITLFVADRERAKEFYARVFEADVMYEDDVACAFKFENLIINLLALPAASELIAPATPEIAPASQLTIWVDDTDTVCAELAERGVELLNGPMDRPWGVRTASFQDPDGHIWEVAASLSKE